MQFNINRYIFDVQKNNLCDNYTKTALIPEIKTSSIASDHHIICYGVWSTSSATAYKHTFKSLPGLVTNERADAIFIFIYSLIVLIFL